MREWYEQWFPPETTARKVFWVGLAILVFVAGMCTCRGAQTWLESSGWAESIEKDLEQAAQETRETGTDSTVRQFCAGIMDGTLTEDQLYDVYLLEAAAEDRSETRAVVRLLNRQVARGVTLGTSPGPEEVREMLGACRAVLQDGE